MLFRSGAAAAPATGTWLDAPPDPDELQRRLEQTIKRLRRELGRTVSATRTAHPIQSILVCGLDVPGLVGSEILDVPADVSGQRYLEVKSLEAEGGNYVEFSIATGGSFAASVFCRLPAAGVMLICVPSGTSIYAKANTAAVNIDWRTVQV